MLPGLRGVSTRSTLEARGHIGATGGVEAAVPIQVPCGWIRVHPEITSMDSTQLHVTAGGWPFLLPVPSLVFQPAQTARRMARFRRKFRRTGPGRPAALRRMSGF